VSALEEHFVDADAFRRIVGRFATGITVVTTVVDGVDHAMTANSFTTVSLEPLLVLVCVEKEARFHDAVLEAGTWAVSVLDASSRATADWFATRGRPLHGQLDRVAYGRGALTGCALLDSSVATVECGTTAVHDAGDHSIVVGEVLSLGTPRPDARPLVYYRSRYHTLP
jgi:flavin reductase (DIM6/NTAB) family NADH-FMN oxidoreductase RutF